MNFWEMIMELFGNGPNWFLSTLFGAILGALIVPIYESSISLFRRLKNKTKFEGMWFEYHTTYQQEEPVIHETIFRIRDGIRHQYKATCVDEKGHITYSGNISTERGHLMVYLKSKIDDVSVAFRYQYPFLSSKKIIMGIWLSFDHDVCIASGVSILSRETLSLEQVQKLLEDKVQSEMHLPLMKIKK